MAFLQNGVDISTTIPTKSGGWGEYSSTPSGTINYISGSNYYYHNTTQHGGGSSIGGFDIPVGPRKVTLTVSGLNLNTGSMAPWEIGLMISTGSQTQTSGYYGRYYKHGNGLAMTTNPGENNVYGLKENSATSIKIPWGQAGFATNFTMECIRNVSSPFSFGTGLYTGPISTTTNSRWTCNFWGDTGAAGNSYGSANIYHFAGTYIQTALSGGNIRGFQIKTPNGVNTTFTFDSLACQWDF